MSTRAVTPDASAASNIEDALETGFLPDDLTYRKTGRFEEKTPAKEDASAASEEIEEQEEEEQEHVDTEEASAASEKESADAAASRAAETQEKEEKTEARTQQRSSAQSESRWAKLSRENRELREKLARAEGRAEASAERSDSKQTSQPAAEAKDAKPPRPKIDDVDSKTGKPKYSSYAEYEAAKDEWLQKDAIRQFQETSEKTAREQQFAQARERIQQEVTKRVTQARKDHPDYDEVCAEGIAAKDDQGRDLIYIPEGSHLDLFLLESPRGQDVIYELSKNLDQHAHIFARDAKGNFLMTPVRQIRELSRIEAALEGARSSASSSSSSSAKPVTRAPRPPEQVSGKGTVAKDAVEKAVEEQDQDTYAREQNARDPRLAALRRSRGK